MYGVFIIEREWFFYSPRCDHWKLTKITRERNNISGRRWVSGCRETNIAKEGSDEMALASTLCAP